MLLRIPFLTALFTAQVSAGYALFGGESEIDATSRIGSNLLSKARLLKQDEVDMTWAVDYSLRFSSCHTLIQTGQGNGKNNNNNKNNNDGSSSPYYTQHLVTFSLCPKGTCSTGKGGCSKGAQYVVDLADFVDAYTEAKLDAAQYACEMVRESCYCDDANDDEACESACYSAAGLTDCADDGDEDFEVQRYLECKELDNKNGNNNGDEYEYNQYYVGPYCSSDGASIYLGTFLDQSCSVAAKSGAYETIYGTSLPYSKTSMVQRDCITCGSVSDDDGAAVTMNEVCTEIYQGAGKCEKYISSDYADTSACDYISTVLPNLESASQAIRSGKSSGGAGAAVAFAWLFAISTVLVSIYAFLLVRKMKRAKVKLASQVGDVDVEGDSDADRVMT